jgi:glutamate/tyrosine decarboxylase-like PLP-dependent enzyme
MTSKSIPKTGVPRDVLLDRMRALRDGDADWHSGRMWSLVYHASDEHTDFLKAAYSLFFHANGLSPMAFPSLRVFESEVVAMAGTMLGGDDDVAGTMTSGGSESILMAVKSYRDRARAEKGILSPEIVLPESAHPAFRKACHYMGVRPVPVPLGADLRADVACAAAAVTENTIAVVGSAPGYPHGVVDPIRELAALAAERGVGCHVDACIGGFLLPWVRRLGYPVPDFDFAVPGVTSISADVHKYGFGGKGASTILYRTKDMRRWQFFVDTDWCGGLYGSPSMTGSRPGGSIAAAWAAITALGEDGYLRIAETMMTTARTLIDGIRAIPGLKVLGAPVMSIFAFGSDELSAYALGDLMEQRGWHMDRQQRPDSLHLMITPVHAPIAGKFLDDLRASAEELRAHPELATEGQAAMYGTMAKVPDRGSVREFVLSFLDGLLD